MEINEQHWQTIRAVFEDSLSSAAHYAMATVNEEGTPHVTPIGSLFLRENATGFYFEHFPVRMAQNLATNKRVCILAVVTAQRFWRKSLFKGSFDTPPAVRLMGSVGERREATAEEVAKWQAHVRLARGTKGYDLMWKDMAKVRDVYFDSFEPVLCGEMTQDLWT